MVDSDKLQKVLANNGMGSRRAMETWIADGRVLVNGKTATLGDRVTSSDRIVVDGSPLTRSQHQERLQCLMYHKPEGQICSRKDNAGRPTVFENLPNLDVGRWISVGRLDINTSGLLLFTNNGELANKLMHPSTGVTRRYMARIRGELSFDQIKLITKKGIMLDDKLAKFDEVKVMDRLEPGANHWIEVSIREGRYREVRRILEAVDHPVSRLKRTSYGSVKLSPRLRQGKTELMAPMQLEKLLESHGLEDFVPLVRLRGESKKTNSRSSTKKASSSDVWNARSKARSQNSGETKSGKKDEKRSGLKTPSRKRNTQRTNTKISNRSSKKGRKKR